VDRAISWYYWIKDLERIDLYRRHPLRNYADSVSIKEFYENRDHSNMQARFVAGSLYNYLYPRINTAWFDSWVLKTAKRNLNQYACIGLQSDSMNQSSSCSRPSDGRSARKLLASIRTKKAAKSEGAPRV